MARITFKAKVRTVRLEYATPPQRIVDVPRLTRKHCDMRAFRKHPKYGDYANSDLFPAMLARIRREVFGYDFFRLDRLPDGVKVDRSGFLAIVTLEV